MRHRDPCELSIIIPAFNEALIILRNVGEVEEWMNAEMSTVDFEIVVVDDGSTDGMGDLIEAALPTKPRLRLVRHNRNCGRGRAIRTGFSASRGNYIICLDADLSYDPSHIARLLKPLMEKRADITLASAYHPDGSVSNVPLNRAFMSRWGNRILSAGFKSPIKTTTCVVRGYTREALDQLELINDGKDLHLEILQKAELFGLRLLDVPADLRWRDRQRGHKSGKGWSGLIPFLSMSDTIASHLVYSYVLKPGSVLLYPVLALVLSAGVGAAALLAAWLRAIWTSDREGFGLIYSTLRETLVNGALTLSVMGIALIVAVILCAFYFAAQQNKRNYDELYVLLTRVNARLKQLEREKVD